MEQAPEAPVYGPDFYKWCGQANALIREVDLSVTAEFGNALNRLTTTEVHSERALAFERMMMLVHKALGIAELHAPPGVQGTFIPVGNAFDAYAALAKVLGTARSDVFLVDPYMDATILTDYAGSVPESARLRLLTASDRVKPDLQPAAARWKQQYPQRPLELRLAQPKMLHDRVILVDGSSAWTVTQSLKDLAKRSPAEIIRADDTAALKIEAYESIWAAAVTVV
ncbi:hypothetical protein AC628_23195 [Bradyrhizobium sp. NAS96.2]|nr:hypothetical protein AC628_23195 [Bradyrhizobium sp. NAS96.2]